MKRQCGRTLKFDRHACRQRNVVERCVGWLKEDRRVDVRYEKLPTNYLGVFKRAMIQHHMTQPLQDRA